MLADIYGCNCVLKENGFKMKYLFALLISIQAVAQDFSANTIPARLKENAYAVVRNHETEFYVKGIDEAVTKTKGTITILDEKGSSHAQLMLWYSKFSKVNNIEAYIYDESGKQIRKLKKADIESFSTSTGQNEIDGSFVKVAELSHNKYPYTISYSYQYTNTNMMFYPNWRAILDNSDNVSVEKASFRVSLPKGMTFRYKEQNMPVKVVINQEDDRSVYSWNVNNIEAIEKESDSPHEDNFMPMVYTGPKDFKVEGYSGHLEQWSDIGKFYAELNTNRDKLPTEFAAKVRELVKDEKDIRAKVRKVYEYMQANTRYVSIQLGIGGWQSMKASEVATKGYGDCKALTNFTKSMLKEIGITSYATLVRAGNNNPALFEDFPSFQFNHVILCVPTPKDTIWLECTNQNIPFGYLGGFTDDRNVVVVTENGGKLARTPAYKIDDNLLLRKGTINIQANGDATALINTQYSGLQQDVYADVINTLGAEDQKKWLYKNLALSGAEIISFSLNEKKQQIPVVEENLNLLLRNLANRSGSRLFVAPNILSQQRNVSKPSAKRKNDLWLEFWYQDIDSISFKIPSGYVAEFLPEPVTIETRFGKYKASMQAKGDIVTYTRDLTMFKGQYPASVYNEWVDFRKKIAKADKNQMVLIAKP